MDKRFSLYFIFALRLAIVSGHSTSQGKIMYMYIKFYKK